MTATIHILFDTVQVPLYIIWMLVAALFTIGWLLGLTVGKIAGENRVMRWYEEREHAHRNARRMMKQKRREDRKAKREQKESV